MENIQADWPIWAIILYLFIKDALPVLTAFITKMTGMTFSAKAKERQALADQQSDLIARQMEIEEKRIDLREREVVALEQIGKAIAILDTRLQTMDRKTDIMSTSLIAANQALAVVMDRVSRKREDFQNSPKS